MIEVSIVEDDNEIRESLAILINGTAEFTCINTYCDCETAIPGILNDLPHVVLIDIGLPGMSGIEGIRKIKENLTNVGFNRITD